MKGEGCPLGTAYFDILRLVAKGDFAAACERLWETNPLPGVTGRLAPEVYGATQVYNRRGERISLRGIERFLDDQGIFSKTPRSEKPSRQRVAVVGSGVSGLTAAFWFARCGYSVTVFESAHVLGGSLGYAYGEFSLPERVLKNILGRLGGQGVQCVTNALVGRSPTLEELAEDKGFSAVLLATGAGVTTPLAIPGEASAGVLTAEEVMKLWRWLKGGQGASAAPAVLGSKVLVVGSGGIAFEAARTAVRLGKEVVMLVQGAEGDIRVPSTIVREACEEGIKIKTFARPVKVETDSSGCVKGLVCHVLDYRIDSQGHLNVVDEEDSEFLLEGRTVINASGAEAATLFFKDVPGLELGDRGAIVVRDGGATTSLRKVFAAGRVVNPDFSLLEEMLSVKRAAGEIEKFFHS